MSTAVPATHVWLDERGIAWVDDTNTKVVEIVLDKLAYGWSPEEIRAQHDYLSLAQIHAAFTYYYDHQAVIDEQIASSVAEYDRRWQQVQGNDLRTKLQAMGKLP